MLQGTIISIDREDKIICIAMDNKYYIAPLQNIHKDVKIRLGEEVLFRPMANHIRIAAEVIPESNINKDADGIDYIQFASNPYPY